MSIVIQIQGILLKDTASTNKQPESTKLQRPQRVTCFNCLGDHLIKDCRRPRNHERIQENKMKFLTRNHQQKYR